MRWNMARTMLFILKKQSLKLFKCKCEQLRGWACLFRFNGEGKLYTLYDLTIQLMNVVILDNHHVGASTYFIIYLTYIQMVSA